MYAIHGVHRIGASRIGYYGPQLYVLATDPLVDHEVYNLISLKVLKTSLSIQQHLGDTPDTCTLTVRSTTSDPIGVQPGSGIKIALGTTSHIIFEGRVLKVTQRPRTATQRFPRWDLECVDQSWQLDLRRLKYASQYEGPLDQMLGELFADNLVTFEPFTFSTQSNLDNVDATPMMTELITELLTRVTKSAGAFWRIQPGAVIRVFQDVESHVSLDSTSKLWDLAYTDDISQVRSTTYVIGGGTTTTQDYAALDPVLHVENVVEFFDATGGFLLINGRLHSYTGYTDGVDPTLTFTTDYDIPAGTRIQVVNFADSPVILNDVVNDPGIVEHVIEEDILDADGAEFRASVDVALFANGFTTITFKTRDPRFYAGAKVAVNLSGIASFFQIGVGGVGDFLVQSVTIAGSTADSVFPVRTVTLGTFQRNLSDLLVRLGRITGSPPRTARV